MDKRGEEILAQKTWMWSIKLRGVVFRLQIHAINTWAPIKTNLTNEEQEQNYFARAMGSRLSIWNDWIKCCPCQSTRSSNLYSNELSKNGFPFTWKPLFEDSKDNCEGKRQKKEIQRTKSLKNSLYPPTTREWVFHYQIVIISMWPNPSTITNRDRHLPFCESSPWFRWKVNKTLAILGW